MRIYIGRPVPIRSGGFLRGIIHSLFLSHFGNKRHILDIRIGELLGRYRVHVTETAVDILESLLGGNHAVTAHRNFDLYSR